MQNKYREVIERLGASPSSRPEDKLPSEMQLDAIEEQLGYPLPANYREFLRDYSGFGFPNSIFPVTKEYGIGKESVFVFYGALTLAEGRGGEVDDLDSFPADIYPGLSLVRPWRGGTEEITWPAELLPIASDKGGNQICLALFGLRPGAILFWVNAPGEGDQNVYLVANTFDEFMHSLQVNPRRPV